MVKVIKTPAEYHASMAQVSKLLARDPAPGTPEAEELETLAVLIHEYEARNFDIGSPGPVEALKFRMEQQNLSQRDLVPFLGSRSKVSEVLSGRRPLTLSMMRALHAGLGIPAKVLLQESVTPDFDERQIQWDKFPLREMVKRGWVRESVLDYRSQARDVLRGFFGQLGPLQAAALYRQSLHIRSARQADQYALAAWTARVLKLASNKPTVAYVPGTADLSFMREIARLSILDEGPRLAGEFLQKYGIRLVIEPHLPGTFLDGAAMHALDGGPIIALTLRYDRIDNFWFSLMHELAHVARHLEDEKSPFYDDLDVGPENDPREKEADSVAGEALIPEADWKKSPVSNWPSPGAVRELAGQLRVNPAIVAGRYRHEHRSYRILNQFVGHGQVRRLFGDVKWE